MLRLWTPSTVRLGWQPALCPQATLNQRRGLFSHEFVTVTKRIYPRRIVALIHNKRFDGNEDSRVGVDKALPPPKNEFLMGNVLLLTVAVLWGSYTPALRAIFNVPGAPTPVFVAASRGVLQATLLGVAILLGRLSNSAAADAHNVDLRDSKARMDLTIRGALEIGLYNTLGTLLQTYGLSFSTATRSAFLVQATALWTPMLAAAFGYAPSPILWASSLVAFVSTILVTLDGSAPGGSLSALNWDTFVSDASTGDLTTLGAAFCYSMATVRLPNYAQRVSALHLAFGKSLALATVSSLALVVTSVSTGSQTGASLLSGLWPGCCSDPRVLSILVWSAVGPGAVSAYLHVKGQAMVSPTDAQIVFSTVPLWSALLAAVALPDEVVGPLAWAGGFGMLLAGLIAALDRTSTGAPAAK